MQGTSILILTADQRRWRRLAAPLASAAAGVQWAGTVAQAEAHLATRPVDLVVVDLAGAADAGALVAASHVPVVAVGGGAVIPLLSDWRASRASSLFARFGEGEVAPDLDPFELALAAAKLVRRDLFGLEKHLASFGAVIESRVLTGAADRDALLAALGDTTARLRFGAPRTRRVLDVADELATNAIYDAPRDATGRPRYAHIDRREKLELEPAEVVTVRYGSDGRLFGLSVTDRFGGLFGERLASCLARGAGTSDQIEHKAGGAGIGLYLALRSADELVVAVEPGRRTEVTALWRLDRRGPLAASTMCYLRTPADPVDDAVVAVELSHSMRIEVARGIVELAPARDAIDPRDDVELTLVEVEGGHFRDVADARRGDPEDLDASEVTEPGAPRDEEDPLAELRGAHLLRAAHPPGIDTTLARLRGLTRTGSILAAATSYLLADWTAACLLEVRDDEIRTLCAAGDAAYPNATGVFAAGLRDASALAYLARQGGIMLGPVFHPACEAALAEVLVGPGPADGLGLALSVDGEVRYLLFAARPRGRGFEERGDHQRLVREVNHALGRAVRLEHGLASTAAATERYVMH